MCVYVRVCMCVRSYRDGDLPEIGACNIVNGGHIFSCVLIFLQ